jgi:predicted DNA-binding transcriptional regulator YafY
MTVTLEAKDYKVFHTANLKIFPYSFQKGQMPIHGTNRLVNGFVSSPYITFDFIMELLSYGNNMKVISPKHLKDEVCEQYSNALKQYE